MLLTYADQYDLVRLLRHVIEQCETRDVEDYAMPVDLATLRSLLAKLDNCDG